MARPSNALKKFVKLYVTGPDYLKGDWTRCTNASGLLEEPDRSDPMVRNMIEDAGGEVVDGAPGESAEDVITKLLTAKEEGVPWQELKGRLADVIEGIAKGDVKASAAQVSMVKYVLEEAKKAEAGEQDGIRNVVLLPVQGETDKLQLEAASREKIKNVEVTE